MKVVIADPRAFAQYLRDRRVEAGLSLREVAAAIGMQVVTLGEFERVLRWEILPDRLLDFERAIPGFSAEKAIEIGAIRPPRS